nr:TfoX/Sxy family DNA transformation protein [Listeria booriae]
MAESIITLEEMPNIGDVLATRLRAAGIETPQELKRYGACSAFEKALLAILMLVLICYLHWKARFKTYAGISYRRLQKKNFDNFMGK